MRCNQFVMALTVIAASFGPRAGMAQDSTADFYARRTIRLFIGSGEGGLYDTGGRVIARHLKRFIPGAPNVLPQNMPGASSVRATEYLFNVAPRDGTSLAFVQPTVVLNRVLDPAAKYDPRQFNWIGRLQPLVFVGIAWRGAPAQTIEDATRHELILAANASTGAAVTVPRALNDLIGAKFKIVLGYESSTANQLALERGEVQGIGSLTLSDLLKKRWVEQGLAKILYTIDLVRTPLAPDAPTIVELGKSEADRAILGLLAAPSSLGQTLMAPPGVPEDRVEALRAAFAAMMKDPEFIADARANGLDVDPLDGPAVATLVDNNFKVPPNLVARLKAIVDQAP